MQQTDGGETRIDVVILDALPPATIAPFPIAAVVYAPERAELSIVVIHDECLSAGMRMADIANPSDKDVIAATLAELEHLALALGPDALNSYLAGWSGTIAARPRAVFVTPDYAGSLEVFTRQLGSGATKKMIKFSTHASS